jgi:hypothetical protein
MGLLGGLGSAVSGVVNAAATTVSKLDLDKETVMGAVIAGISGDPVAMTRAGIDIADGKEDKWVSEFDKYAGVYNLIGGNVSGLDVARGSYGAGGFTAGSYAAGYATSGSWDPDALNTLGALRGGGDHSDLKAELDFLQDVNNLE